ncbi:hypothetical protein ACVOMV_17590 [Mesorhizobium atlanticum]
MSLTQKLINDGNAAVDEMLTGIPAAHPEHLWRPGAGVSSGTSRRSIAGSSETGTWTTNSCSHDQATEGQACPVKIFGISEPACGLR